MAAGTMHEVTVASVPNSYECTHVPVGLPGESVRQQTGQWKLWNTPQRVSPRAGHSTCTQDITSARTATHKHNLQVDNAYMVMTGA